MIMNVKKLILVSLVLAVTCIFLSGCRSSGAASKSCPYGCPYAKHVAPCPKAETAAKPCPFGCPFAKHVAPCPKAEAAAEPCPKAEAAAPCPAAKKPCAFTGMFSRKHKEAPCPGVSRPCPSSPCPTGMVVSCEKYSGAEKGSPVLKLETMVPEQVIANQPFDYKMRVTNLTGHEVDNVIVVNTLPEGLEFRSSTPEQMTPAMEGRARWLIGKLGPNCSETIDATAVALGEGTLKSCADVFFATCAEINIVKPRLAVTKSAPAEVLQCDRIPLAYCVTNIGSGVACDITVEDGLQDGLTTSDGSNRVVFKVASLPAGESQRFETMVDASKAGRYSSMAVATWQGTRAESEMPTTIVNKPVLALSVSGPEQEYMGRPLTYDITVTNSGDGVARDTVVEAWLPESARFESATESGLYTHMSPGKVTWNLGPMAPDTTKTLRVVLSSCQIGTVDTKLLAKAYCAESASGCTSTQIAGAPGLLTTVVDCADPIEVGQTATYIITVLNQGEIAQSNIVLTCTLDSGMEYVSSSGTTTGTFADGKLSFAPIAKLGPKDQASWQVIVKAVGTGDMRFKISTISDALAKPVEKDEATHFYK